MYLKIGVVCFGVSELPELKRLVDAALRREKLPWGSSTVVIRRDDPNIQSIEAQWRQTAFAGVSWKPDLKSVMIEAQYLLVVGDCRKFKQLKAKLHGYPNVRKVKFIDIR